MKYIGQELEIFANARRWKHYYSTLLNPYILGNVLEVGGGLGSTFRTLLNDKVVRWVSVEPDEELARRFELSLEENPAKVKPEILSGTISNIKEEAAFDCILYIDVLEHIKEDFQELTHASFRLKKGGKVVVLSPAHQGLFTCFDQSIGHFRRYSRKSLLLAGANPNLKNIKAFYLDSVGLILSFANKVILRQRMPTPTQIQIWDSFIVPLSQICDRVFSYHIGKSVVGVWKKIDSEQQP